MSFWKSVLQLMDLQMETPELYGWFHLLFFAITILATVILCMRYKENNPRLVRKVVLIVAIIVTVLEIYKQINYSFSYSNGITFDFQWYAFPWQFCSMPMYVGLLAGLTKKGKIHESACAFLATYSIFAGAAVMFYPASVFIGTIGINIQTMICHGSMITVGVYLLYTGYVKLTHKTLLKALPVFIFGVITATIGNELAYYTGLLETDTFNMFFISRHCEPSLPVYSLVQTYVPYPFCLILYVAGFTAAAYIVLLAAMGVKKLWGAANRQKTAV